MLVLAFGKELTGALCLTAGRFPVVAMGVLKWVDWTVSEPRYFQLQTDHTPVHLALLDEVGRRASPSTPTTWCCRWQGTSGWRPVQTERASGVPPAPREAVLSDTCEALPHVVPVASTPVTEDPVI